MRRAPLAAVGLASALCVLIAASAAASSSASEEVALPAASAPIPEEVALPAASIATGRSVRVHRRPSTDSRVIKKMPGLRYDYRPTIFELVARERDTANDLWFQIRVPGRPNGRRGWVSAESVRVLYSVADARIEIDRSRRRLRFIKGGRTVIRAPVAVGKPGAPTPLGSFYVAAEFRPGNSFLGRWAFETSAYAALTDWPRGGIVGLHGTSAPESVGHRASHGCLRVFNKTILRLRKRVRLGTPLEIHR
jgi:lipoprotein-anchoring transpeptidase ErfK/SrfK